MSASYPQDNVHSELRKIIKTMANNADKENKTETTVSLEEDDSCLRWFKNIKKKFSKLEENEMDDVGDFDEVDGKVDELLSPLVKLYFLKILIFDIGISLGDVVTDILQAVNLTFDENWNLQWSTYHYGLTVFAFIWLPLIPVFVHQATFRKENPVSVSFVRRLINNILFVIFFPLVPTLMYIKLLLIRRSFNTNHQKLLYLKYEQEASQLKSVIGSLESPLQLILLLWLLMRGILRLPWDEPLSSSCIEDSLGRIACFPSIPLLSISFSFLSIVKSIFDLNLLPVLSSPLPSRAKGRLTGNIILAYFPFLLCNLLFRLTSYALILTYIDYWAAIPASLLYLVSLSLLGLVFIANDGAELGGESLPLDDLQPTNSAGEASNGLQWNGSEWLSRSNYRANSSQQTSRVEEEDKPGEHSKTQGNQIDISSLINESNSPIFINSVAAYFFPTVYTMFMAQKKTELRRKTEININFMAAFLEWQRKILCYQTLLFNSCLIFTLLVIGILVIFVPSFNYRTNILDCFWFSTILVFLVLLGIVCLLWSFSIYPSSVFPLESQQSQTVGEVGGEDQRHEQHTRRRRRLTGESAVESVGSGQEMIRTADIEGPPLSPLQVCWCSALSLALVLPGIVGLLLLRLLPHHHLYLLTGNTPNHQLHLQALEVSSSYHVHLPSREFLQVKVQQNNSKKETIKLLAGEMNFHLFIDNTEEESWRLSSPQRVLQQQPYIVVRNVDWGQIDFNPDLTFICAGSLQYCVEKLTRMIPCSNNEENRIYIDSSQTEGQRQERTRTPRKILDSSGQIFQSLSVRATCFQNGLPCQEKVGKKPNLQCNGISFNERVNFFTLDEIEITSSKVIFSDTKEMEYCCGNSTTFVNFFGKNCLKESFDKCNFSTDFIDGVCHLNIQLHSSVCLIESCVIKKSFQSSCRDKSSGLVNCDIEEYYCNY